MTTNEAYELWSRIARGEKGEDLDAWVRRVAGKLIAEVFNGTDNPKRRADAAKNAVGFSGRRTKYDEFDKDLDALADKTPEWVAATAPLWLREPDIDPKQLLRRAKQRRKP